MGDGDCGETLKTGATSLLAALDSKNLTATGSVLTVLQELEEIVETKMGGTLGGILGIFFVALRNAVETNVVSAAQTKNGRNATEIWGQSLAAALEQLSKYTTAKVGDRTVMDTLIPFADAVREAGSFDHGVIAAVKGAEATKTMTPKLGRATYVAAGHQNGNGNSGQLPPDPGAWGAMVAIQGLRNGYGLVI